MLIGATAAAIIPLFSILLFVTVRGLPQVFEPGFIFNDGRPDVAGESLGLAHAILGTLIMTGIGAAIGIPIGLMAGIYLSEFGRGRFAGLVRFMADMLQGIPSIIVGIVVYQVIVRNRIFVDTGANVTAPQTGWAGGIALAIMIVPVITRTTEEILKLVPDSIREAGLALGVPKWKVTLTVILPAAFTGVVTGILLGVARIAGETAPLIFTAGLLNYFPSSIGQHTPALTTYIFQASRGAAQNEINQLWGAAFVLVFMIFGLTLAVRFFTRSRLKASL
jgi:phosphate transport system permease protein